MSLQGKINEAFSWRIKPQTLTNSTELSAEEQMALAFVTQLDWQNVTSEIWEKHFDVVSWLSPDAFCYYLPGIFKATVEDDQPNLIVVGNIISMLDRSPTPDWWDEFFLQRWPLFTKREFYVIQEWIGWLANFEDLALSDNALTRALDTIDLLISKSKNGG